MHDVNPEKDSLLTSPLCLFAYRAIKLQMANEGLEAQRKEEEIEKRKRKKEADAAWEGRSSLQILSSPSVDRSSGLRR
jgi:hypothetical protein